MKEYFSSIFFVTCFVLFISLFLYHGILGIRVILDDYVQSIKYKMIALFALYLIAAMLFIASLISTIQYYVLLNAHPMC